MIFPFKTSKLPPKVRGGQARMAFKGPKTMPEARCREAVAPHWSSLVYKPHEYYGLINVNNGYVMVNLWLIYG